MVILHSAHYAKYHLPIGGGLADAVLNVIGRFSVLVGWAFHRLIEVRFLNTPLAETPPVGDNAIHATAEPVGVPQPA